MTAAPPGPMFSADVAELYDGVLVPMLFEPYAAVVAERLADIDGGALLEVAAGTGVVTRAMARALPSTVAITATDLSPGMLQRAEAIGTARSVTWQQADVMALPFDDDSFDVVVCQFGVMFFDPKAAAFAEVLRVLRPGGRFEFSVWDGMADNEFADVVVRSLIGMFPDDPITFVERIPHGYHDADAIRTDLRAGGFTAAPSIDRVACTSRAATATDVATAYCLGTPMRGELEARRPGCTANATRIAITAIEAAFGRGDLEGRMSATLVRVTSP